METDQILGQLPLSKFNDLNSLEWKTLIQTYSPVLLNCLNFVSLLYI